MGFARDMLIANLFGVDAATDAFFVAFKIPNFLRRLFAEGAFAHAFVPILSDYQAKDNPQAIKAFIAKAAGTLAAIQVLLSLIGIIAAPLLIMLFAPGFYWENGQFELAVKLLQITFPYLLFISLTAFAGGILNAHGKFAVPAITPVFLNICMIIAAVWVSPYMAEPIMALAWGVFAAGIVQLLFQIPALIELGLLPKFKWGFADPDVKRMMHLMLPAIFGVSVVQINLLVDTVFTSFLVSGSVSWLYYSDRLVEFPIGIFGVAVSTVILPSLAKNHIAADAIAFSKSLDWGLKLVLLVGLPATLGLTLLSEPLISTLFQYNQFDINDVRMSSKSLMAFSLGLLAFILIKVLVPGFTARQDAATPVRFGIYSMLANLVLNALLLMPLAHAGPALATTLAAYLNAGLLLITLLKNKVYLPCADWQVFISQVLIATVVMSGFLYFFVDSDLWLYWHAAQRSFTLLAVISVSIGLYLLVLWGLGLRPKQFWVSHH
jgi:putative peptidoglycan lipid II flippase